MNNITPLFKDVPKPCIAIQLAAARNEVIITRANLNIAWQLYSTVLDRYLSTGIEAGLRKASDVQEWALLEHAEAQATLDQLTGVKQP